MSTMFPFVGRSQELKTLLDLWEEVSVQQKGPRMITLLGEPGYGKTRLIREFYNKIASKDLHQNDGYWPARLSDNGNQTDINPSFQTGTTGLKIPWLWWGIRCESNKERNSGQDVGCALLRSRHYLMQHTIALEQKRDRSEKIGRLRDASLAQLLKLFEEIPIVGTVMRHYFSAKEWLELYQSTVDAVNLNATKSAAAIAPGQKMVVNIQNEWNACLKICQAFIDSCDEDLPTIPMVLIIDDAHAADPLTIKFVYQILHFAQSKQLPLLIVATHWAKEWKKTADCDVPKNLTMTESWKSFRQISFALPMRPGTLSNSVFVELECERVDCGLIFDHLKLKIDDRLRSYCLEFVDGNPQMLNELLSLLYQYREHSAKDWWFENPSPDLQLSERGFVEFCQKTKSKEDFLKERAEQVHDDQQLSILLQLGALQGQSFLGKFTSEVWSHYQSNFSYGMLPEPLELLQSAEMPHHVIRLSDPDWQQAKFCHRAYYDSFLGLINPAKKQELKDAITNKMVSWLECKGYDLSNTIFFCFAVEWFRTIKDDQHLVDALDIYASQLIHLGRASEAANLFEERLNLLAGIHGPQSPQANIAKLKMTKALMESGQSKQVIQILESLRMAFVGQEELWIDSSRILARALQKKSESDGIPKRSFATVILGVKSSTPERDRAVEILREVWENLGQRQNQDSLDVVLAGADYANAIAEGGQGHAIFGDEGILLLPCCALLLERFANNEMIKDMALTILGRYLLAWGWPRVMNTSPQFRPRLKYPFIKEFYERHYILVVAMREKYPKALPVFRELQSHRLNALGKRHPLTIEAARLKYDCLIQQWHFGPKFRRLDLLYPLLISRSSDILGDYHLQTLECKAARATFYQGLDGAKNAPLLFDVAVLLKQILEDARAALGEQHPFPQTIENRIRSIIPTYEHQLMRSSGK
jgi:hypothetical protein